MEKKLGMVTLGGENRTGGDYMREISKDKVYDVQKKVQPRRGPGITKGRTEREQV